MRVNSKTVKTKDVASTNEIKEIVLAKISTKQAIIVAVISLVSVVAVTMIAKIDKIRIIKNALNEEIGYYEGRSSLVERAFRESENINEIRRNREKFQELHNKVIDALRKEEN